MTREKRLSLIDRVGLRPGALTVQLHPKAVAELAGCAADDLHPKSLRIEAPFQMRRRGVETKLHLGEAPPNIDRTLVTNIIKARAWLKRILAGESIAGIANADGTSPRRIKDLLPLALLAPPLLESIAKGTQPPALTTDYLVKTGLPPLWEDQIKHVAKL